MPTELQTLQAEITGEEKAIRTLIGEKAALNSKLKREQALIKLHRARVKVLTTNGHPAVNTGPTIPHGERFPDVSSYQPNVDWAAVRHAGSVRVGDLAFVKISEGGGWTDPYGSFRFREMAQQGFPHRGGYHFYHPSVSPSEQAAHFLTDAHQHGVVLRPSDILCCDLEVSDGEPGRVISAGVREFAGILRQDTPCKLWLYGGGPFLREFGVSLAGYDAHWLSAYVGDPFPYMIYGRNRTVAWQYTDGQYGPSPHVCPGIGAGDMSIIL